MEKKINIKLLLTILVIILIIGLSIAFATMLRRMKVKGNASVDPANWDIHFKNLSEPTLNGNATVEGTPTIANEGVQINNIRVNLLLPGDSVTYTVDIENSGDINSEISLIEPPTLTSVQQELFEFKVYYTDTNEELKVGDELGPNEVKNVTIKIKYKDIEDPNLLPEQTQTINLSYKITYIQSNKASLYYASGLPKSYTPLEYLESTGTQYIDTGINVNTYNSQLVVEFKYVDKTGDYGGCLFASENNSSKWSVVYNGSWFLIGKTNYSSNTNPITTGAKYKFDINLNNGTADIKINDTEFSKTYTPYNINVPLYIFADNKNNTSVSQYSKIKLYSFSYSSETTNMNLIPALDPNGRPCMYDTVSGQPFYNQGTGEFYYNIDYSNEQTYASGIPKSFTELQYLQSVGGWIDTDIISNIYDKYEVLFDIPEGFDNHAFNILFYSGNKSKETKEGVYVFLQTNNYGRYIEGYIGDKFEVSNNNLVAGTNYKIVIENRNLYFSKDNDIMNTLSFDGTTQTQYSLRILGGWDTNRYGYLFLKKFCIYDGETGNIKHNLIPALDPNGIPCMYDTVSKQPFYNAGTGDFLYELKE